MNLLGSYVNLYIAHNADPSVLPPCEVCEECRWRCCLSLFQCHCLTGTHGEELKDEVVVYKDETEKDLVEIRCPWNYLSMRNKIYHRTHTLDECSHRPTHDCGSPHTEVEQNIWNIWKKTASANASNRMAVSWEKGSPTAAVCLAYLTCGHCICAPLLYREDFLLKLNERTGK